MNDNQLFALALGLQPPWFVASRSFDVEQKQLDPFISALDVSKRDKKTEALS